MRSALITIAVLVLTPLLVGALLGWLRRRFPVRPAGAADAGSERLATRYRSIIRGATLGWLLAAGLLGAALTGLLAAAASARAARFGQAEFTFVPDWPFWILPASFLGLIAAALLVEGALRLALGSRFEAFARYDELRHGFSRRGTALVYSIIAAPCLLLALGLWDYYAVAEPDGLRLNEFWSARERRCLFRDLTEIRTAPEYRAGWWVFASTHRRRHFWFEFADGCTFSTRSAPRGIQLEERIRLAAFVAERAGVTISEIPIVTL